MRSYRFVQVDVFTNTPFGGNQLAVFPEAEGISEAAMQTIAREMNFSETTFVLPPAEPNHDARVRIFTPGQELPMAGHPTVGTGFVLGAERGRTELVFELGVGPTPVTVVPGDGMSGSAAMQQQVPRFWQAKLDAAGAAALVSLSAEDAHPSLPVLNGSAGVDYLYVPVRSRKAVAAARPNAAAMETYFGEAFHRAVYVFSVESDEVSDARGRMFFLVNGAPLEDPATGSAAGPLGGYLVNQGVMPAGPIRLQQGYEMGRPSDIEVTVSGSANAITGVQVGGGVVKVAEGSLFLES
ncbi:MAG: PhzF family phenazine biosynthesis protein [Dehalococcoidia bacterium]